MKQNLTEAPADYGVDPFERDATGKVTTWKLVPSGRILNSEQLLAWRSSRTFRKAPINDCCGLSWDEIERMQGGKLNRNA